MIVEKHFSATGYRLPGTDGTGIRLVPIQVKGICPLSVEKMAKTKAQKSKKNKNKRLN